MKCLIIKDENNKTIFKKPIEYTMSDELEKHMHANGISGGFLGKIPLIGNLLKMIIGNGIKLNNLKGYGINAGTIRDVNGGFLSAIIPFLPALASLVPSLIDLVKGNGIRANIDSDYESSDDEEENDHTCRYKFQFFNGGRLDYEDDMMIHPIAIKLLQNEPNLTELIQESYNNHLGNGISANGISANGISANGFIQGKSQIIVNNNGIDQYNKKPNIVQGISQINFDNNNNMSGGDCNTYSGIGNGISGNGFKRGSSIFKNIGEI